METNQVQYTGHGENTGGLQGHSVGDDYPFCIIGVDLEGHHDEKHKYQARHLTTGWEGPIREDYMQAHNDIILRRLQVAIRLECLKSRAYSIGYVMYTSGARVGNPYRPSTPEYGEFGKGFYDARRLQSMQEAADTGYTNTGLKLH